MQVFSITANMGTDEGCFWVIGHQICHCINDGQEAREGRAREQPIGLMIGCFWEK